MVSLATLIPRIRKPQPTLPFYKGTKINKFGSMTKKRAKKYDKPLMLQSTVEWDDLMKVAMEKPKENKPKAKRTMRKKK